MHRRLTNMFTICLSNILAYNNTTTKLKNLKMNSFQLASEWGKQNKVASLRNLNRFVSLGGESLTALLKVCCGFY